MNNKKYEIKVLEKSLNILNCFTPKKSQWSINELCEELHLNRTTVYRILEILKSYHYVEESQKSCTYVLGKAYIAFGSILLNEMDLKKKSSIHLEALSKEIEETASLSILYDNTSLIIDSYDSPHDIKVHVDIGKRSLLHATSHGKILLSAMSNEDINQYSKNNLPKYTAMTLTGENELLIEVEKIRKERLSYDIEEYMNGLSGIGAPVFNYNNNIVGAISIVGYSNRIENRIDDLVGKVKQTASIVSREMGYTEVY